MRQQRRTASSEVRLPPILGKGIDSDSIPARPWRLISTTDLRAPPSANTMLKVTSSPGKYLAHDTNDVLALFGAQVSCGFNTHPQLVLAAPSSPPRSLRLNCKPALEPVSQIIFTTRCL